MLHAFTQTPKVPNRVSLSLSLSLSRLQPLDLPPDPEQISHLQPLDLPPDLDPLLWQFIISSTLTQYQSHPWFFIYGIHNQSFVFDPLSDRWLRLPTPTFPPHQYSHSCFLGVDGFFLITAPNFTYSKILKRVWRSTSPLQFSRINPRLGVFESGSLLPNFSVVGGVRCIGISSTSRTVWLRRSKIRISHFSWTGSPRLRPLIVLKPVTHHIVQEVVRTIDGGGDL